MSYFSVRIYSIILVIPLIHKVSSAYNCWNDRLVKVVRESLHFYTSHRKINHWVRHSWKTVLLNFFPQELFSGITTQILIPIIIIMRNPSMKRYITNQLSSTLTIFLISNFIKNIMRTCLINNRVLPEAFRRNNVPIHVII